MSHIRMGDVAQQRGSSTAFTKGRCPTDSRRLRGLWCVAMDHDAAHKYLYTLAPVMADLLRLVVPD